jgi:exopolyphosphatase / guanosine-5'-triphosphate,3'-diphosphate pyrophosphatase
MKSEEDTAVIDVGTSTIRLLIARKGREGLKKLITDRAVTRLGHNVRATGVISQHNADLSIASIAFFKARCDDLGIGKIHIVGTGALREAQNGMDFVRLLRQKTGLVIEIISGEEEAELTLLGASSIKHDKGRLLAVDVGGGSTEIILSDEESPIKFSIPVGALNTHEEFINSDPPQINEITSADDYIRTLLLPALSAIRPPDGKFSETFNLVATGGSATTLAAIKLGMTVYEGHKIHGCILNYSEIESIFRKLASLRVNERINVAGIETEKADIILTGTMIVMSIMQLLSAKEITISDYGLMEGIILRR